MAALGCIGQPAGCWFGVSDEASARFDGFRFQSCYSAWSPPGDGFVGLDSLRK